MRITVDINPDVLSELCRFTGETKMSPAVAKAVGEFVKQQKAKEFARQLRDGHFDYPPAQLVEGRSQS